MTRSTAPKMISTMSRAALCALLGLCLWAGLTPRARAATASSYVVTRTADDTAPGSLRAAIAQVAGTGGTVTFAIPNTDPGYSSTANTDTITLTAGELMVTGSLNIVGPVAPAAAVVVTTASSQATNTYFGVFIVTVGTVAFSNLTITNGESLTGGGGIMNSASLTLNNCAVDNNFSYTPTGFGGGGLSNSAALTLNNCTLNNNLSYQNGGAIANTASLTLNNCTASANVAYFASGGGIANAGTLTATGSSLLSNSASGIGGGLLNTGTATLNGCTLGGNVAVGGGGAFNSGAGALLTLNSTLVSTNSADNGGGLDNTDGNLTLSACTITTNRAGEGSRTGSGGGILNTKAGTAQISDCLVVDNSSYVVAGMSNAGTLTIINSTFTGNDLYSPSANPPAVTAGALLSGPATLVNDIFYFDTASPNGLAVFSEIIAAPGTTGPTVTYTDVLRGYPGAGNISLDPQFARNPVPAFSNVAADPGDEHLKLTSPAVNAGTNAPGVPLTDIEGKPRPAAPATPSMGAYEVPGAAGGFSAQGGFTVTGGSNQNTGTQVVAKFSPGGTPGASFTAAVSFGDGTAPVAGTVIPDPATAGVFDVTAGHTYVIAGSFTVTVVISGPGGTPTATVTSTAAIQPAADVTSQVSILRGGLVYSRAVRGYIQLVTLYNYGPPIAGPISLVMDGLTPGAVLVNPAGTTQYALPAGSPYQNVGTADFGTGVTLYLSVQFTYAGTARFGYTPRVLAGPGVR